MFRPRTRFRAFAAAASLTLCSTTALAQVQAPPQADEVAGAAAPALRAPADVPGTRLAPAVPADRYFLPETVAPDPVDAPETPNSMQISGYVKPAPAELFGPANWMPTQEGGWLWAAELTSPGAVALRVQFSESFGDDGLELRVYDPASGSSFGPYNRPLLSEEGTWWTTIIFGESIGLEFHLPNSETPPDRVPPITAVNYTYEAPLPALRGCSHIDASCYPQIANIADAVCVLATITPGGNVSAFCSGALLNRGPNDFAPLVMTANHCLGSQTAAGNTSYIWFFETPSCDGTPPNINNMPRSNGSLMLKRHTSSDWNLVGLYEPPAAGFYVGWSSGYWEDDSDATGIHHPGGSFRRASFGLKVDDYSGTYCDQNQQNCFDADTWEILYLFGFTQPGSSGSPVFDSGGRVRGTLTGGPTDECEISQYGRLDLAYVNLRYFLGNSYVASPVYVANFAPGDPGNNGSTEQGIPALPFNRVHEATFAVRAGDVVAIAPGSYNEPMRIWRPMTLTNWTSDGVVRIGAP